MKKLIALSILSLGIIFLTGCSQPSQPTVNENQNSQPVVNENSTYNISDCKLKENAIFQGVCYKEIAIKTGDLSICELITDNTQKIYCYRGVAITTKDINVCELIPKGLERDICYRVVAWEIKDENICDRISEDNNESKVEKANCYDGIAFRKNDPKIFSKIKTVRYLCGAEIPDPYCIISKDTCLKKLGAT